MPVTAEVLRTHLAYTAWASRMLVDAVRSLPPEELSRDFGTADKSVLGSLVHIYAADRVWLARFQGEAPQAFVTETDYGMAVLENDWPALHRKWKAWAGELTDDACRQELSYTDLSGHPWRQPIWELVMHVVNHGTHHRGQVAGFLRSMGHAPPKLDLVHYYRMGER
jgi:uncharacterized damage-inducible protein DinB